MPISLTEIHDTTNEFKELSLDGRLIGCIGALDGWLCRIKVPSSSDMMNVSSYFSGHYQSYGVNVQATCDVDCRFKSIPILCSGGTGGSKAFAASYVHQYVSALLTMCTNMYQPYLMGFTWQQIMPILYQIQFSYPTVEWIS
jgi:hypothetical protein